VAKEKASKASSTSRKAAPKKPVTTKTKVRVVRAKTSRFAAVRRVGSKIWVPRFIKSIGAYFIGAWRELRQVRWPNRRATWGLTFAVILFSAVLAIFIVLLDLGFSELSKRILLK
jgi:preprotein translocase SecE subunit